MALLGFIRARWRSLPQPWRRGGRETMDTLHPTRVGWLAAASVGSALSSCWWVHHRMVRLPDFYVRLHAPARRPPWVSEAFWPRRF